MIIDGHAHAAGRYADGRTLTALMDELGINKVALCPGPKDTTVAVSVPEVIVPPIMEHPRYMQWVVNPLIRGSYAILPSGKRDGNEYVRDLAERYPERIIQVYWPDPRKRGFLDKMEREYESWGFKAVKLHQACTHFHNDDASIRDIVAFCEKRGLPLYIHLWSDKEAEKLVRLAAEHPAVNFILLHVIGLEPVLDYGKRLDNVYIEISPRCCTRESRLQAAIDGLGADHVIYGSDLPFGGESPARNLERVRGLALSDAEKDAILGGNLARLLGL